MGIFGDILDEIEERTIDPLREGANYLLRGTEDDGGLFRGGVGDVIGDVTNIGMNILDAPRTYATKKIGEANYALANIRRRVGLEDEADWLRTLEAYQRAGGRGVWEDQIIADVDNPLLRGLIDIGVDPLTYAGVGLITGTGRVARGIGRGLEAAEGAGRLQRITGRALQPTGTAIERTGEVLRAPDRYIFDPAAAAIGRTGKRAVKGAASRVPESVALRGQRFIARPLSEYVVEPSRERISKLFELAPVEQARQRIDRTMDVVGRLLEGERTMSSGRGMVDAYVGRFGESTMSTVGEDIRAGLASPVQANPVYRGPQTEFNVRNRAYSTDTVRRFLGGPYTVTNPENQLGAARQNDFVQQAKRLYNSKAFDKRMSPTDPLVASLRPSRNLGIINQSTPMGDVPLWESEAERDTYVNAFTQLMLERAPVDNMGPVGEGIRDLRALRREFVDRHADQGMTDDLFIDVYRAAREKLINDHGLKVPHTRMAGSYPGGGGLDFDRASDEDVYDWAVNSVAGLQQANYVVDDMANELVRRGVMQEFQPGGRFTGRESLTELAQRGGVDASGLRIATFEELLPHIENEFGGMPIDQARELYDAGLERFRREMVNAVEDKFENVYGGGQRNNAGLLLNAEEADRLVRQGMPGINFYSDEILELRDAFESNEDFEAFIDLLVVTSPHTNVRANTTKAMNAWLDWKLNRREALHEIGLDDDFIDNLGTYNPASGMTIQEGFPEHRKGIYQVVNGEPIETPKLRSYRGSFVQQTRSANFGRAYDQAIQQGRLGAEEGARIRDEVVRSMREGSGTVTNDMWNQIATHLPQSPTLNQFQMQEAMDRFLADRYGMTPDEVQAVIWSGIKEDFGYPVGPKGTDESPMRMVNQDLRKGNYRDMEDFVRRGGLARVTKFLDASTNIIKRSLDESAKTGGYTVWKPSLGGRGGDITKATPFTVEKPGAGSKKDIAFTHQGVDLISHEIQPGEDAGLNMLKFKLMMDDVFSESWDDVRLFVNANTSDGSIKVNAFYFPKNQDPDFVRRMQARADRMRSSLGDNPPTDQQFEVARQIMRKGVERDRLATAFRSTGKLVGNEQKVPVAIGRQANEILKRIADPGDDFFGGSYDITPNGLVERPQGEGFPVSLASAGKNGILDPRKDNSAEVARFIRKMAPVINGADDDLLYLGVFDDAPNATFDLNIDAVSREEAEKIGALTNQIAYYDPTIGDVVPLTRGAMNSASPFDTPEKVDELLGMISESRASGRDLEEIAAEHGYVIEGATVNPAVVGIRSSGNVADDVMSMAANTRVGRAIARKRQRPTQADLRESDVYNQALEFNIRSMDNEIRGKSWLSDEENNELYGQTFADGTPIGEFAEKTFRQLTEDQQMLRRAGITWDSQAELETKLGLLGTQPRAVGGAAADRAREESEELRKIVKRWDKLGITPKANPVQATQQVIRDRLVKEAGISPGRRGFYEKARQIWGEIALASPRYVFANLATNVLDSVITGNFNFGSASDILRYAVADLKGFNPDDLVNSTKYAEWARDWGIAGSTTVANQSTRSMIGARGRKSQTRAALEKFGLGSFARVVETPLALAQGVDMNARTALAMDVSDAYFEANRAELLGKLDRIAANAGVDTTGMNMLPSKDPAFIENYYKANGFSEGYAKAAARQIANMRNRALKEADKEVNRIFLSYRKTNLDEAISKVVPFHYWASRKTRFYAEEMYRNPVIAANYARAVEGIDRASEDPGMNARQKGFLAMMAGPTGFMLLMNPDALMGVIKAGMFDQQFSPEGETEFGGIIRTLKNYGVGLYPWLDGALNMLGTYGDTFEPDMLGIRHRAIVGSVVNWMRGEGLLGEGNMNPGAAPYAEANLSARESVSTWASAFLPDWLSQPVKKKQEGSWSMATLDDIIETRIIEENPGLTNMELAQIMNDPESPQYQSAFQDAARAGVIGQLLSFSTPVSWRVDSNKRDADSAGTTEIIKEAERLGVNPWEVNTSNSSLEFRANYEKQTGRRFNVEEWNRLSDERELKRAAPEARKFVVLENEYQSIVPDNIRPHVDMYWAILQGRENPPGANVNLAGQSDQVREWWANRYLEVVGQRDQVHMYINLQRDFRQSHPEFAQYKDWQSKMFVLQAAYGGSLDEYRRIISQQNPAARRYFEDVLRDLQDRGVDPSKWSQELDRATVSSNAWYAIHGQPYREEDPAPTSNVGTGDVMPEMLSPYANTQYNVNQPQVTPEVDWVNVYNQRMR